MLPASLITMQFAGYDVTGNSFDTQNVRLWGWRGDDLLCISCTAGATRAPGVLTPHFFENVGLVIRPNLHRKGEVCVGEELFWHFDNA